MLEHYQGQLDSGAIHFHSAAAEGAIFFDKDGLLEGAFESKKDRLVGKEAVERLIHSTSADNYTIGVFQIDSQEIYFWAGLLAAKRIYEGLSAEFTDLEALIRKMVLEKLSGYIEISLSRSGEVGLVFLRNGLILGGVYSRQKGGLDRSSESREAFIQKAKENGGVFHVSRIAAPKAGEEDKASEDLPQNILGSMKELVAALETLIHSRKSGKGNFRTLLRKKFIDLAETFPFLDPFAGEFTWDGREVHFKGDASESKVAEGLLVALKGLADENGVQSQFQSRLEDWLKKHGRSLIILGILP